MKFNWGTGIAIFYSCFVTAMISIVIFSMQNKVHLVQENYYAKDLAYEDFRQKRVNGSQLNTQVSIHYLPKKHSIQLIMPKEMIHASGKLILFRPSNKFMDQSFPIRLNANAQMEVQLAKSIQSGFWKVQLDWESAGKAYYREESLSL